METEVRINPIGLHNAATPGNTPGGGMLEAENVVFRRPGSIDPRPGFSYAAQGGSVTSPWRALQFRRGSAEDVLLTDGATSVWDSNNAVELADEAGTDVAWGTSVNGTVSGDSLFLNNSDRLRVVHAPTAATAYPAGAPIPSITEGGSVTSVAGPAFADNMYAAYRVLLKRPVGLNGRKRVMRGAPSGRLVVYENSGPANQSLRVHLHRATGAGYLAGDQIEVYRNITSETYPDDYMYLARTITLTSAMITAGYVDFCDDTTDNELGQALYLNPDQEGAAAAHFQPPQARCSCEYNGSLFLGDLTYPAQFVLTYQYKYNANVTDTGQIGARSIGGTWTNGSAVVTGVSGADIALLKVGMIVYASAAQPNGYGNSATPTIITAIGATSFTTSNVWTGSTATYSGLNNPTVADSIKIGSQYFPAMMADKGVRGTTISTDSSTSIAASTAVTADYEEDSFDPGAITILGLTWLRRTLRLTALAPTTAPFQMWATNGDLYEPPLAEPAGTGVDATQDVLPDYVAWSNEREPEHFRFNYYEKVGESGCRVYNMFPAGNSLLIFTDKGLIRGSGFANSGIRFDMLDSEACLIAPQAATALSGVVYAWCEGGVLECTENGTRDISTGVITDFEAPGRYIKSLRYPLNSGRSAWAVPHLKEGEVVFGIPTAGSGTSTSYCLVYNVARRAWAKWSFTDSPKYAYQDADGPFVVHLPSFKLTERDVDGTAPWAADRSHSVTISGISGTTVTISGGSGWTPAVGDLLDRSGTLRIVTAITSATVFDVDAAPPSTGSATAYVAYTSSIAPGVCQGGVSSILKVWGEGAIWWGSRVGLYAITLSFRSPISAAPSTTSQPKRIAKSTRLTDNDLGSRAGATRFLVPRTHARTTHLNPKITIRQAGATWAFDGLSVKFRPTSDRVQSRHG